MNFEFVWHLQFACCLILTGLIWTIQLVHYPAFLWISESKFNEFHAIHSQRITYLVGPLMLLELLSAIALVIHSLKFLPIINLALLLVIWLSTAFVSIPIHNKLSHGSDRNAIMSLIRTNWSRTLLWTARSLLLAFSLHHSQL